jgi:Family of unknown function (DUF5335)
MKNRLIEREDWGSCFEDFTRRHEGQLATVRVVDPRLGSQVEARSLPFEGISAAPKGRGPIVLQLGKAAGANVEHPVADPSEVWLEVTDEGADAALEILSEGGRKTILEFLQK